MEEQRHPVNIQLVGVMQKEEAKVRRYFIYLHFACIIKNLQNEILDDVQNFYYNFTY